MLLMISEVYNALRATLPEPEACKHAIVLSDPNSSYKAIAGTFRAIGVTDELADRAARALADHRSCK